MVPITRLYADADGHARFEDIEIPVFPEDPPPDMMGVSEPWQAVAVLLGTQQPRGNDRDWFEAALAYDTRGVDALGMTLVSEECDVDRCRRRDLGF